jgi:homoserine kinase type II
MEAPSSPLTCRSAPVLVSALRRCWGLEGVRVTVHNGGMGSQTWFVDLGAQRWVAKAVAPGGGVQFAGGMAIAQRLEQAGIPAGAPVPGNRRATRRSGR